MNALADTLRKIENTVNEKKIDYTQSNISTALDSLVELKYFKVKRNCDKSIENGYCCIISPEKHSLRYTKFFTVDSVMTDTMKTIAKPKDRIRPKLSDEDDYINPVKIDSSVLIKQYWLEKKLDTWRPSLIVEEWCFKTNESKDNILSQINKLTGHELFLINKSSVTWWQRENKIYFILPVENYVSYDVPIIRKIIEDNL